MDTLATKQLVLSILAFLMIAVVFGLSGCATSVVSISMDDAEEDVELQNAEKRVRLNPNDVGAHKDLANYYNNLGRDDEAIAEYNELTRINPNDADAHYFLGVIYNKINKHQKAINSLQEAIRVEPGYPDAHYHLGQAYDEIGQHQKAMDSYAEAIKFNPSDIDSHLALGKINAPFCGSGKILPINCTEADKNSREIWFEFTHLQLSGCRSLPMEDTGRVRVMRNGNLSVKHVMKRGAGEFEFLDIKVKPEDSLIAFSGKNGLKFGQALNFELKQNIESIVIKFSGRRKVIENCHLDFYADNHIFRHVNILPKLQKRKEYELAHADAVRSARKIRDVAPPLFEEQHPIEEEYKKQKARKNSKKADRLEQERQKWGPSRLTEKNRQQAQAKKVPTLKSGTGSGFFVSKLGHVITNAHVVKDCNRLTVGDNANQQVPAKIISTDSRNDLALLLLSNLDTASAESKSLIKNLDMAVIPLALNGLLRSEDVRLGEKVLVAGYPFGDVFSNTIKVTTGIVSATRGVGDDSGQFQLDAAVQPGNSGGPIYDSSGNIVGVVISQLDKLKVAKAIGSLPENVNFGIKASIVRQFLISSGLPSKRAEQTTEKSTEQLAQIAKNQALMVMCLQ